MSSPTLGPWRVVVGETSICGKLTEVRGEDDRVICCNEPYYPTPLDPNNAHLIAAAPEMLEALKLALQALETIEEEGETHFYATVGGAIKEAAQVIAKAENRKSENE